MPKIFYTERDIDDMKARGITSIDLTDNVVITDLALERAMRYEMKINRVEHAAPKATYSPSVNTHAAYQREAPRESAADAELKQKIMGNLSTRAAALLAEEMEYLGAVRLSEVEQVQQQIVDVVRKLEDAGEITVHAANEAEQMIS